MKCLLTKNKQNRNLKEIMKKLLKFSASLLAVALFTTVASAIPMFGDITISGGATMDNNNLSLANAVTAWSNVKVTSEDGNFLPFVSDGDAVAMAAPWTFNPSTPTPALWSVDGFTFDLATITSVIRFAVGTAKFLTVVGDGWVSGHGFGPSEGSWSFSTQTPSAKGVFSFSAATSVPDGGMTIIMLGVALSGLGIMRRKIA